MFERFTERALEVMSLARDEARRFSSEHIGTEHILLGIVRHGDGVAAKVLKNLNVDLKRLRQEVEKLIPPPSSPTVMVGPPYSPRAKRAIELADEAARQLGHDMIGTDHLLLGLLKEGEGIAARALANLVLKPDEVRDMTLEILGAEAAPSPDEAELCRMPRDSGLITENQIRMAFRSQLIGCSALADILVEQGFVPEETMPAAIGWHWALRAASGRGG